MSGIPFILLFIWHITFMTKIDMVYTKCISNFNCSKNTLHKVCCAKTYQSQFEQSGCFEKSCAGMYCTSDGDCGGKGECCNKSNRCTTLGCPKCNSKLDCGPNLHCCQHPYDLDQNVCRRDCIGERCHSDSDCAMYEYCLSSKTCWSSGLHCRYNRDCKGSGECCKSGSCVTTNCSACYSNSDCGFLLNCCIGTGNRTNSCCRSCNEADGYCSSDFSLPSWLIPTVTTIIFLLAFGKLLVYCYGKIRNFIRR